MIVCIVLFPTFGFNKLKLPQIHICCRRLSKFVVDDCPNLLWTTVHICCGRLSTAGPDIKRPSLLVLLTHLRLLTTSCLSPQLSTTLSYPFHTPAQQQRLCQPIASEEGDRLLSKSRFRGRLRSLTESSRKLLLLSQDGVIAHHPR